MNPRKTALLAGVLLVLAGIAFLSEREREAAKAPPSDHLFPAVVLDEVDEVKIRKQGIETELAKQGGSWIVVTEDGKPADPKLVSDLLGDLETLTNRELVSSNPENHEVYEVGVSGVEVSLYQEGNEVAAFVVGKPGADFNSSYVRPRGADETYRVPTYMRLKVDRGSRTWRNQTLLEIPQEEIVAYRTAHADTVARYERDGATWRTTEPWAGKVEQNDVLNMVLASIAKLKATGFADTVDAVTAGLEPPERTLEIDTADGATRLIEIGAENPARQTYSRIRGEDQIYLVPVGRWNTIFRKIEELAQPDPASEAEPGTESGSPEGEAAPTGGATP